MLEFSRPASVACNDWLGISNLLACNLKQLGMLDNNLFNQPT